MDNGFLTSYKIDDRSYVSFIKREIHNLLLTSGFSTFRTGEIDIIVSEITSNVTKYVASAELLYRVGTDSTGTFLEIFCIDNGKGIANLNKMMLDGNSTSSTLGQGLGAIQRLSDDFHIYTQRDWGTILHSKSYQVRRNTQPSKEVIEFGKVQVCAPSEIICGDGYFVKRTLSGMQIFMGDGLGHGKGANEAVEAALVAFKGCRDNDPSDILRYIHNEIKKTRGVVITIACVDFKSKEWKLCGIGNISTRLYTGLECKNYTPYNGIVGHNIPRTLNSSVMPLERYQTIIMHSDGLRTRWSLTELASIIKYDPNIIAAALYKDNARQNDDMSVLVGKINIS